MTLGVPDKNTSKLADTADKMSKGKFSANPYSNHWAGKPIRKKSKDKDK